jgi:hypothetical protein
MITCVKRIVKDWFTLTCDQVFLGEMGLLSKHVIKFTMHVINVCTHILRKRHSYLSDSYERRKICLYKL